jgi:hypothetical protein
MSGARRSRSSHGLGAAALAESGSRPGSPPRGPCCSPSSAAARTARYCSPRKERSRETAGPRPLRARRRAAGRLSQCPGRAAFGRPGLATAVVCHEATSCGIARRVHGPRFVYEQVRALHLIAPRVWRERGNLRFRPTHLSANRSGAASRRSREPSRVPAAERKQVLPRDVHDGRRADGAERLADGEERGRPKFGELSCFASDKASPVSPTGRRERQ